MRIHWNRIAQQCLATLVAGMIAISTLASNGIAAQAAGKTGTLTIIPKADGTEVSAADYDGTFKVYKIADYAETGTFTATDELHYDGYETTLTMDYLSDEQHYKTVAQTVTAWIDNHTNIEPVLSAVKVGVSNSLPYGLYLIMQDQSATGYTDTTPFLVMIPTTADGKTQTAVTAYPKITKTTTPDTPETPDKPHKPHDDTPPTTPTKYGKVALGKSDAVTGEPLKGVVFYLYKQDGNDWILTKTDCVTDEDGIVYVDNLSYGNYRFIEVQPLPNYIEDKTPQDFTIDSEETVLLTMTNTPETVPTEEETPHGYTGDESNMMLYGAAVAVAAVALVTWFIWKKRSEKETK